jgi:hypothetical protein
MHKGRALHDPRHRITCLWFLTIIALNLPPLPIHLLVTHQVPVWLCNSKRHSASVAQPMTHVWMHGSTRLVFPPASRPLQCINNNARRTMLTRTKIYPG